MEISVSDPNTKMRYNMHFIKPFEGYSTVAFDLAESEGQTQVTQTMRGKSTGFLPKLMCALFLITRTK